MSLISPGKEMSSLEMGKTLFDYADELAVKVPTSCGRSGRCHECVVEVEEGMDALGTREEAESFLSGNYRLACQARIEKPEMKINFSPIRRTPKILSSTLNKKIELDPIVSRKGNSVLYNGINIGIFKSRILGLAIDLGTTTIVMDLIDLETGITIRKSSFENPQKFGGSDVMNRISYDSKNEGELKKAIINAINGEVLSIFKELGFLKDQLYEIVVAGNSTMRDILFDLNVQSIGQKPYKSIIEKEWLDGKRGTTSLNTNARELGLRANPEARVYSLPLIASHVGADIAADLVAVDMQKQEGIVMLVDVGTNTEVVVSINGNLTAASCPAGPAFEGGGITYGMPGYEGAIESFNWDKGNKSYKTIGNEEPEGICGSGLIDILAELLLNDQMTTMGVFPNRQKFLPIVANPHITISREDASNLAQAKAANFCGQLIVMREAGVLPRDVEKLYLAGGFANYVNVQNAIKIGFLAPVEEEKIVKVGNAAVQGAREVLLSRRRRESIEGFVSKINHIELETTPDFFNVFVEGCQFKPMPSELL